MGLKAQSTKPGSIIWILCSIILLLILAGCGDDENKIRVGVSLSGLSHPDSRLISLALEENAGKYGAKIRNDQKGLTELLAEGIEVLILSRSDSKELESAIEETHRKSIPVVILDNPPPQNLNVEACVRENPFDAGKMAAEYVVEKLSGRGNVIVLEGPRSDEPSRQITLGMYDILEQYEDIRIVASEPHPDWDGALAETNVRSTLEKYADNIQAVLAASSQLIMGAVKVISELRLNDRIITAGIGADMASCEAIIAGNHDVEVDRMPYERGMEALKLAVSVAKDENFPYDLEVGENTPKIKVRFGPLRLITRANVSVMNRAWPQLADEH